LDERCSVSYSQFANNFDEDTGVYDGSLDCSHRDMNNSELDTFHIVNEITGSFSINNNKLTNTNGLQNLTTVGRYLYIHNNPIEDLSGLSNLTTVGGDLDLSNMQTVSLDSIANITTVSGSIKIQNNAKLVDISGLGSVSGFDGKKIYIDTDHYEVKANAESPFCSAVWDIYSANGNEDDDMSLVCESYDYQPTDIDQLRDLLGKKCSIDSQTFYTNFEEDTGTYNDDIVCHSLVDDDMNRFSALLKVDGNLILEDNQISTLDGIIRLKEVTGILSIYRNTNLSDIKGISNVAGIDGSRLVIDEATQYSVKADSNKSFCSTQWDIYQGENNIDNDLSQVCSPE
jgi:hypothetical protein